MLVTQRSGQHAKAEGHQNHDQASGLTLRVTVRPWSAVAFSLFYVGLCRILGLVVSCRVGEASRTKTLDHGAPTSGSCSRTPTPQARAVSTSRSGDPRGTQPPAPKGTSRSFLVTPETLLRWHRESARGKWRRWRAQGGTGRPPMAAPMVELIIRLGRENRRWGCIRIQGELRKLGIRVSQLHS